MKFSSFLVVFLIVFMFGANVQASQEYDISQLETPVIPVVDYSKAPLGTLDSLKVYVDSLFEAAGELLRFINSIFEMLGMEEDTNVKELLEMYEGGMEMVEK